MDASCWKIHGKVSHPVSWRVSGLQASRKVYVRNEPGEAPQWGESSVIIRLHQLQLKMTPDASKPQFERVLCKHLCGT